MIFIILRLFGLPAVISNGDCKRSHQIIINTNYPWPFYVYPFAVFLLYWMLAVDIRIRRKAKVRLLLLIFIVFVERKSFI